MLAIVLSGGGSRGSYEIGVWKALLKLKIKYDIVTGTSVGALNGVMMVQKDYKKSLKVWQNIDYNKVVDDTNFNRNTNLIKYCTRGIIKNGSTSVNSLESLINKVVNEKKFFKSKINFGLVTFNYSKLSPKIVHKCDLKDGELKKYIIASSSCYPFFKKKEINNEKYIDGGYHDNLPINLACSLGADEIIAVDLKTIGIKQKIKNNNIKITYISPINDIGGFLSFEKEFSKRNIKFGYNDTMKKFNKLDGTKFTFKKNHLIRNYNKCVIKYFNLLTLICPNKIIKDKKKHFNSIVEECGLLLGVDESNIYSIKKYNKILIKEISKIDDIELQKKKIISVFQKTQIVKSFINLINKDNKELSKYNVLLSKEVCMAIYLYIIK